ncbi:MAG: ankyrin repeat domain-containing protein, partial [Treponemataceae bacterium]|nr:ankyrin repeat domain-containing protein [Treponemataceae bacterium]
NVNAKLDIGWTALILATENGEKDIVELLIKAGADVNAKENDNGKTVLMIATEEYIHSFYSVESQMTEAEVAEVRATIWVITEMLIKAGADVNTRNNEGETALMQVAREGHKELAELLIKAGADVNAKLSTGWTVLVPAAVKGHKELVELFIKAGADINAKLYNGKTALIYAIENGKGDIAELLVKAGAGNAELLWAIQHGQKDTVELLIDLGADVNATDSEGISVLTYAALYGRNDIVELLKAAGARE